MKTHEDWLEQVWEIKKCMAEKYAGVPADAQLRDMHEQVKKEFAKRGWTLKVAKDTISSIARD